MFDFIYFVFSLLYIFWLFKKNFRLFFLLLPFSFSRSSYSLLFFGLCFLYSLSRHSVHCLFWCLLFSVTVGFSSLLLFSTFCILRSSFSHFVSFFTVFCPACFLSLYFSRFSYFLYFLIFWYRGGGRGEDQIFNIEILLLIRVSISTSMTSSFFLFSIFFSCFKYG